jgi:hypothetical protein
MLPLIQKLAACFRNEGLASALVDLVCVKPVSATQPFAMHRRKVCCDCGDRILLFPKTGELWVVQLSSCLSEQDCLRQ